MSDPKKVIKRLIDQKLLALHTAYFAEVLKVDGNEAKIQPLNMIKEKGEEPQKQAVLTVPILQNVKKLSTQNITINGSSVTVAKVTDIKKGDIVYCLCAERDITETKNGKCVVPVIGHHRISDSVIVGVM
jgi:hypothetical protein